MSTNLPYGLHPNVLFHQPHEVLSGYIEDGRGVVQKASDLEERVARAIRSIEGWDYWFRVRFTPLALGGRIEQKFGNLKGETEADFLAFNGHVVYPLLVDGEVGHFKADWQSYIDEAKLAEMRVISKRYGWQPPIRIRFDVLYDQNAAMRAIMEILR